MVTAYNIGEEIDVTIRGYIKRISIDSSGVCYTLTVTDSKGKTSELYLDDDVINLASLADRRT